MFSKRWLNNNKNSQSRSINLFGNTSDNANNSNVNFTIYDISVLLKCVEMQKIPLNVTPQCDVLEGLINCNDFLMNKQDSVITVESLINFFKTVKPRFTRKQKYRILRKAKNELLIKALKIYEKEWDDKMENMRQDMAKNHVNIRSINNVAFDHKTSLLIIIK